MNNVTLYISGVLVALLLACGDAPHTGSTQIGEDTLAQDTTGQTDTNTEIDEEPCIEVLDEIDFGEVVLGKSKTIEVEIHSCGGRALYIGGNFVTPTGGVFSLDDPKTYPMPGNSITVPVTYTPTRVSSMGADPHYDEGSLRIGSDPFTDVDIKGFAVCGKGSVGIWDDDGNHLPNNSEVAPQTELHLSNQSNLTDEHMWSIDLPGGDSADLPDALDPTYEVNTVGEHVFKLRAWGVAADDARCKDATHTVQVI